MEDRASIARLLEQAARVLGGSSQRIALVDPEIFPSPHRLVRCRVVGGRQGTATVVVKQITTTEFTASDGDGSSHRLLNEWATLLFLNDLSLEGPWPRLLGGSVDDSFVVLEDLGEHPTVLSILMASGREDPVPAIKALGFTLGEMHSRAYGQMERFRRAKMELGAESPRSDSTHRLADSRHTFERCFQALDVEPHPGFWEEVADLDDIIHTPGPLHTVIHADAGPHNFLWNGARAVLVDYEFATVGHCLLDVVSARLGFPHSSDSHTVPFDAVEALEGAYRSAAASVFPQFEDEATFQRSVTDACAHWALARWAGLWQRLFSDAAVGGSDETIPKMRSQAFTVYRRFTTTARESGHRLPIVATTESFMEALQRKFPDLTEVSPYSVFESS